MNFFQILSMTCDAYSQIESLSNQAYTLNALEVFNQGLHNLFIYRCFGSDVYLLKLSVCL